MKGKHKKRKVKFMTECELKVGDKVTPSYDKERKNDVGEVIYIDVIEDNDGLDEFGTIMWDVYFCDVKFSDGVVKCYRDCRLKKVR